MPEEEDAPPGCAGNHLLSAKRRIFSKKFRKSPKKHLQHRETCAIIILGCERLGRNATSVLRKPRYALMREVAATPKGWRVFPRSMSDLRTGRKNYECEGICTALHSAARTNVRDALRGFFPGELPSGSPDFLMQTGRTPGSVCDLSARLRQNKFRRRMEWQSKKKSEFG